MAPTYPLNFVVSEVLDCCSTTDMNKMVPIVTKMNAEIGCSNN